jgi:hypothetical protein
MISLLFVVLLVVPPTTAGEAAPAQPIASAGMASEQAQPAGGQQPATPTSPTPPPPPPREGNRPAPAGQNAGQRVSVGGSMKLMNRSFKQLEAQVSDKSKRAENLRLIGDMERGCATAKATPLPRDVLEKAGDDAGKARVNEQFRSSLLELLKKLIQTEEAIADGKTDAAKADLDEVIKMRDKMHKEMGIKDD